MEKKICVFCSSSNIIDKIYFDAAYELGTLISKEGYSLLYGGSDVGLMKHLLNTVKRNNVKSIGIIPQKIVDKGLASQDVDKLIITPDMHTRKAKLESLADAFVVLPGGFGTLDELSDVITLKQLGYHNKPIIILNTNNFYDKLLEFFEHMYFHKYAKEDCKELYYIAADVNEINLYINNYKEVKKWININDVVNE